MLHPLILLQTKWCPAPGCDYAVDFIVGSGNYDVTCRCSYSFCWNVSPFALSLYFFFLTSYSNYKRYCQKFCALFLISLFREVKIERLYNVIFLSFIMHLALQCAEEAHRPVDCGTVGKWILKNSAESENMNWWGKKYSFVLFTIWSCFETDISNIFIF